MLHDQTDYGNPTEQTFEDYAAVVDVCINRYIAQIVCV